MSTRKAWFEQHSGPTHQDWRQYSRDLEFRIQAAFRRTGENIASLTTTTETLQETTVVATGKARYHDTTYNPIILLQGDEDPGDDAVDVSGNGYDVALTTGTGRRTVLLPGEDGPLQGYWFDLSTYYTLGGGASSDGNNALRLTGDMTIEWIGYWNFDIDYTASRAICGFGIPGTDGNNNNCLYRPAAFQGHHSLSTFHEHSTGTDVFVDTLFAASQLPTHYCLIRSASGTQYDWMVNGQLMYTVTGLTAPEGSSAGTFKLGAGHTESATAMAGAIASFKIVGRALTLNEARSEYNRTLGPVYGEVELA